MKTYNILGKNNDMVITIGGVSETDALQEALNTLQNGEIRIEEVE